MIERSETTPIDLSPKVTARLLTARRQALAGELSTALGLLEDTFSECDAKEAARVGMLWAELLYQDDQSEAAAEAFDRLVMPNLHALPEQVRFAYKLNREYMQLDPLKGSDPSPFNRLTEEARAAGIVWEDYRGLVRAWDDSEAQRLRAALEKLQEAVFGAYRVGYWSAIKVALERYGRVALKIDDVHEAAEAAILGEDERLAKQVAEVLVNRRDVTQVRALVETVRGIANLKRHFVTGCTILYGLSDAIPDDLVGALAAWLLPWASATEAIYRGTGGPVCQAWQVLEPLGHRLPAALAQAVAEALVAHPLWKGDEGAQGLVLPVREQMVKAASHLVYALPPASLGWFAQASVPLALERRWDTDYGEVINLLCHLANRGGTATKEEIGKKLFAGDQRDFLHGQIAEFFGQQFLPAEKLETLVPKVCDNHLLSVQTVAKDQEPKMPNGSLMQMTDTKPDGSLVVRSLMSMVDWAALVRHFRHLSRKSQELLVQTAMSLIMDSENLLTNRESLLRQLADMVGDLPLDLLDQAVNVLEPLARGQVEVSPDLAPASGARRSLAIQTATSGRPEELRAMALIAIARLARRDPEKFRGRFEALLEPALIHPDVAIRRGAFAAFRDFPARQDNSLLAVLMGTRDADPEGAMTAFAALAGKQDLELSEYEWRLLLYSIRGAAQSPSVRLRRHAAGMLARRISQILAGPVREQAEAILADFRADVCVSVREAADPKT